jgi:hypothetical protein
MANIDIRVGIIGGKPFPAIKQFTAVNHVHANMSSNRDLIRNATDLKKLIKPRCAI